MSTKPWWSEKWGKNKTCVITQTRLRQGKNKKGIYYTTTLQCSHRFCTYPLLNWIKNTNGFNSTCPVCRKDFTLSDILKK